MIDEDTSSIVFLCLYAKSKQHASIKTDIDLIQICHLTIQTFSAAQT